MKPRMPRRELPDSYKVEIVLDSVAPSGARLTTFALTYPRFVHAELMTHRIFSRNSASSQAIPSEKMRKLIKEHPALPVWWGKNQSGMQAREELSEVAPAMSAADWGTAMAIDTYSPRKQALTLWLEARDLMIQYSARLAKIGLHKQLCNRLTEPWMPITVLVSATSFANWFHLRDHKDAQPEIQVIATEMHYRYIESKPIARGIGDWHMPYIRAEDTEYACDTAPKDVSMYALTMMTLKKISVGRCARVSYLTHDGVRDPIEDVRLHDKLLTTASSEDPGHFSPFEHVAQAMDASIPCGNFVGWRQYRKQFLNEAGPT